MYLGIHWLFYFTRTLMYWRSHPTKFRLYPTAVQELQQRLQWINITFPSIAYSRLFTVRIHNTHLIPCLIDEILEHKDEFLFGYFNYWFSS